MFFRTIVEHLSRNVVLKRRLPSEFGFKNIFVSPGVALRFWNRDLRKVDRYLFKNALELVKTGDVVWDIGSSIGLFTFASAALAGPLGKVLCLEPDICSINLLNRSLKTDSNNLAHIDALPLAISDDVGLTEFIIAKHGRASNHFKDSHGLTQTGGARECMLVMTVTLDWLLDYYVPPNVVKIDTEGGEEKALIGGKRVLSTIRPKVLCEVHPQNKAAVTKILKEYGYILYNAEIEPINRTPLDSAAFNTIAYPI
jgi:FkbM family methyltransferase